MTPEQSKTENSAPVGSTPLFAIGDKAQFTVARAYGRSSIRIRTLIGTIVQFSKPTGVKALLKYSGGNYAWKRVSELRRLTERSELTEAFMDVANHD